jgi:outer membrane protein OmpA-like peptidoglycan-associated protein
MRYLMVASVAWLSFACSHPQNPERKDPLTEQVTGTMQPVAKAFLKDDPAAKVSCRADADCPLGALCYPGRDVCFSAYPTMSMMKVEVDCPLVPLYFAFDSAELVPEAKTWVDHDAQCLFVKGSKQVVAEGYADARGDSAYNTDLSRRRAEAVKEALAARGLAVRVAVRGEGERDPVLKGTTEHDYAYNRRVELKATE